MLPKFSRSYGLEALKPSLSHGSEVTTADAKAFLNTVAAATVETFDALAEGTDVRLTHPEVIGSALVAKGRVVHLSAFPTEIAQSKPRQYAWVD
ncbi:ARPP-1 family domain-containing protein [Thermosynechococcus sp. FA-CM-4201]